MSSKPFPPPNGMTSFWRSSPGSLDNHRSTEELPSLCDILIIGAGYSGGSLVTHMLSQTESKDKSIVVLEARQLCSGATGRNGLFISRVHQFSFLFFIGGHIKPDVYNLCSRMASNYGIQAGAEIAEFELANVEAVKNFILDNNVDCDLMITQAVDVQLSEDHNATLKAGYDKLVNAGVSVTKRAFYVDSKYAETVSITRDPHLEHSSGFCIKCSNFRARSRASKAQRVLSSTPPAISGRTNSSTTCSPKV
jgi:hypothetical protein